jgi:hypothetical protein
MNTERDRDKPRRTLTFNPTISFDGIAIIVSCITCALWFGGLSQTVKQHAEALQHHEQILQTLSDAQRLQSANIAVLQALVNERTKGK